jgi:hypothetical protein
MGEMLKGIRVIACEKITGTATDAQIKKLEKTIKEINEICSFFRTRLEVPL